MRAGSWGRRRSNSNESGSKHAARKKMTTKEDGTRRSQERDTATRRVSDSSPGRTRKAKSDVSKSGVTMDKKLLSQGILRRKSSQSQCSVHRDPTSAPVAKKNMVSKSVPDGSENYGCDDLDTRDENDGDSLKNEGCKKRRIKNTRRLSKAGSDCKKSSENKSRNNAKSEYVKDRESLRAKDKPKDKSSKAQKQKDGTRKQSNDNRIQRRRSSNGEPGVLTTEKPKRKVRK